MGDNYRFIKFNVNTRSEWVLAIQHAENNGFPVHSMHTYKLDEYTGGCGVVCVRLNQDTTGLNPARHEPCGSDTVEVKSVEQFKHAVNCFCHDGYLNDENLGEI
ncbi:hypothetical protein HOU36_gp17 [Acinetobacter phage vB_AbaP_B09_Aci08]|uniref:Uncharacterized protein n=1 Tax=Acinetobacter phage vB_AbaP_B09_Aci08 TaxID=2315601 RepID=A0A386KEY4_9CAUD|nr:hypothetical protein HOU36_gp17 [Acinetobacter phage vB_AbaP_B09_Aci08]AYD82897.1 hypothetical protein Aci08_17 [Acinetobacter phage vB_AbaP_B09_Aci08]